VKPLFRSLALGVFVGLVILVITGAWMDQQESADEPGLFPAAGTVLKRIAHGTRTRVIRDPHVQTPQDAAEVGGRVEPIAHHSPTTAAMISSNVTSQTVPRIVRVEEESQRISWPVRNSSQEIITFSPTIQLVLASATQGVNFTVKKVGETSPIISGVFSQAGEIKQQVTLSPGINRLVADFGPAGSSNSHEIVIRTPKTNFTDASPLAVETFAQGKNTPFTKKEGNAITLFGRDPTLRLEGAGLVRDARLRFFLLPTNAAAPSTPITPIELSDVRVEDSRSVDGRWSAILSIPSDGGLTGTLRLVKQFGENHVFVDAAIQSSNYANLTDAPSLLKFSGALVDPNANDKPLLTNRANVKLEVKLPSSVPDFLIIHALRGDNRNPLKSNFVAKSPAMELVLEGLSEGRNEISLQFQQPEGNAIVGKSFVVVVRTQGPRVVKVEPQKFGTEPGYTALRVYFSPENPLQGDLRGVDRLRPLFTVLGSNGTGVFDRGTETEFTKTTNTDYVANYDEATNSVLLKLTGVIPDIYQLTVKGSITDIFGNKLEGRDGEQGTNYVQVLGRQPSDAEVAQGRGIVHTTGNFVPYQEFTRPREQIDGFNPSDKVETRVARLYYYRDAHRVAQIINRKVKSFNRAGVDTSRQLADRARNVAEQKAVIRQQAERAAIEKAQKTRRKETELRKAENAHARTLEEITAARLQGTKLPMDATAEEKQEAQEKLDGLISQLESSASRFASQVEGLQEEVQQLRDLENEANELTQRAEAEERLSRDEQFRREVAAARADPDTYAEGKPTSDDPVEQVSVSVIGEGLIQLRGPIKGINIIRTMIDQIDSPVGQVRVAVHTVQLNGERADRIEEVSTASQLYIDQARFLTLQSGELLRRSVVQVAAMRADEARGLNAGETQEDRDQRYLYAYFGRDFVEELKAMDSEFLRTGNKLLSLHSMDTTSLSSALTLMALARNDTRMAILQQFEEFCRGELPMMEQGFFEQNMYCGLKKHHFGQLCKPPIVSLASNARFESLKGFFAADVAHQDTMTPLQREFLRLAQILKSRLIVEMELKQRVTERGIIEERLGNRLQELQDAAKKEREFASRVAVVDEVVRREMRALFQVLPALESRAENLRNKSIELANETSDSIDPLLDVFIENSGQAQDYSTQRSLLIGTMRRQYGTPSQALSALKGLEVVKELERKKDTSRKMPISMAPGSPTRMAFARVYGQIDVESGGIGSKMANEVEKQQIAGEAWSLLSSTLAKARSIAGVLSQFRATDGGVERNFVAELDALDTLIKAKEEPFLGIAMMLFEIMDELREKGLRVNRVVTGMSQFMRRLHIALEDPAAGLAGPVDDAIEAASLARSSITPGSEFESQIRSHLDQLEEALHRLHAAVVDRNFAQRDFELARRPLDHKKFLDMLIDETEDKYIELLEGTRAHTANIDNYIKRLTTALDDDFNTQFYNPAFRLVRESSAKRYYNVQFGQIETTSILANNRAFAKVSPAASMEFDLPHRDIILTEAISGAKALMNDVGALANDPTFLAMAKMSAGQPSSVPAPGSTNGFSVVRNVVPGLGGETTEQVLAQNANGGQQFGSNLENLIPDPAIYKFETGTGYEIRPVIQPDGQAVVFDFQYLYSTQIREPVRADEKHLGRIKRHHIDTDVQLSNFELREVSKYIVALKASRTSRGVPLLEDIPIAGALFRPAPSDESSLQQNSVYAQATIFPTLFDLMGLRWAPVVADLDPLRMQTDEFTVRGRRRFLRNFVDGESSRKVDEFLRIPPGHRREDLYHPQETIPYQHPNGYEGPGGNRQDSNLREGYTPTQTYREQPYAPPASREGSSLMPYRRSGELPQPGEPPLQEALPRSPDPQPIVEPDEARIQGAGYRSYNSPSRIPGTSQSATGYSSSTRSASSQGMTPTPASGASLRRSWGPSSEPTPGATPTPAYSVSSPMPLGR
jgi:type II secretory pathway component GspD/PulD (secretin)